MILWKQLFCQQSANVRVFVIALNSDRRIQPTLLNNVLLKRLLFLAFVVQQTQNPPPFAHAELCSKGFRPFCDSTLMVVI